METPEEEAARVRAEVAQEIASEESGEAQIADTGISTAETVVETPVDPWAGVNPALKQAFDTMSQQVVTLQATENRLRQAESRIGAINNELYAAKKAADTVKESPSAEQIAAASSSDEKWESLKGDFPEWAEAFDGRLDKKLAAKVAELKAEIQTAKAAGGPGVEELKNSFEERFLTVLKPKWRETIASPEWKTWLAQQPPETVALTKSDHAEDAISVLSSFEGSTVRQKTATEIAAERKERIKTSVLPRGGKSAPVLSEADMTAAELRANIGKEIFAES